MIDIRPGNINTNERLETEKLRRSAILLKRIAESKISQDRYDDKFRVAQSFCLYLHDSIEAILCLSTTPYVSQGGAIARTGIESCILGAYLLISCSEILRRYVAFSAFAVARNVERYLELFPEAAVTVGHALDDLLALGQSRINESGFDQRTQSGVKKSTVEQAKSLDAYAVIRKLPADWLRVHSLGLSPVQAFAHPSADATIMSFEQLNIRGARLLGHERGQYLKAMSMAVALFQYVLLSEVPNIKYLVGLRPTKSCTLVDGFRCK